MSEYFKSLENCNFWHRKPVLVGVKRHELLKKIRGHLDNSLIKVFLGQRRAGKSYLMRQSIGQLIALKVNPKNIFYFNKEMIEFEGIKTHIELKKLIDEYIEKLKVKGKKYLFLDEIQDVQGWEKLVNSYSQNPSGAYEVFITGSNSTMLSSELSTYLSGRYVNFEVLPFSYSEYLEAMQLTPGKSSYLDYLQTGGLPALFLLKEPEVKSQYMHSLRDTILLKDIVQRYAIKDPQLLQNLFDFLMDNIGGLFSNKKIVDFISTHYGKTNHETLSNYLKYLENCFLIHGVQRYDVRGKAILTSGQKYYLNDMAFRNYLRPKFDLGLGKLLENAIYLHYRRLGYGIFVGKVNQAEVDFVLEKGAEKKYVQVSFTLNSEAVVKREYGALESIEDSYEKTVISLDDRSFGNRNGIRHQLWD
jgi:predicted AAA+ superfamily ATPase